MPNALLVPVLSEKWRNLILLRARRADFCQPVHSNTTVSVFAGPAFISNFHITMSIRGERFVVDVGEEDEHGDAVDGGVLSDLSESIDPSSFAFVGDIVERQPTAPKPPTAPTLRNTQGTGFPEHKKRTRVSAFKQQRSNTAAPNSASQAASTGLPKTAPPPAGPTSTTDESVNFEERDRQRIHEENAQRVKAMSPEEVQHERDELMASLSPSMIEALLKRANLDEGRGDTGLYPETTNNKESSSVAPSTHPKEGPGAATVIEKPSTKPISAARSVRFEDDAEPEEPGTLQPTKDFSLGTLQVTEPAMHFPQAPSAPELDPTDPEFLESLHQKYFPSLPADPSKLAWMAPIPTHGSIADRDSPYSPHQPSVAPSALRFDFRGALLPPRISRAVPVTKGLHHHGEAPESAGYTVPELARLARSAFPAQRCVAFQTLGRLLYRLGRGDFGDEGSEIAMGLWRCVDEGKVIETLEAASNAEGGHQGSKVYATEAVWLWHKGGEKKWKAG